jgi:hypothetical protein
MKIFGIFLQEGIKCPAGYGITEDVEELYKCN